MIYIALALLWTTLWSIALHAVSTLVGEQTPSLETASTTAAVPRPGLRARAARAGLEARRTLPELAALGAVTLAMFHVDPRAASELVVIADTAWLVPTIRVAAGTVALLAPRSTGGALRGLRLLEALYLIAWGVRLVWYLAGQF